MQPTEVLLAAAWVVLLSAIIYSLALWREALAIMRQWRDGLRKAEELSRFDHMESAKQETERVLGKSKGS